MSSAPPNPAPDEQSYDVLILGGGFAGVWAARTLRRQRGLRIGLIADQNVILFHPMLAEVCGASLSPLHVVNPIRKLCPGVDVLRATIQSVDLTQKKVLARPGPFTPLKAFSYRHVVIAVGGVVDLSRVPGMAEHALPLKSVGDAIRLRSTIIDRLEEAHFTSDAEKRRCLLSFAVVGGGYSGVEVAGQIADLLHDARRLFPWLAETPPRIMLLHSGPYLLPQIGEELGRFAEKKLRERGIELFLDTRVSAVTASKLHLPDRSIEAHTVVTTVGNAPSPVLAELARAHGLTLEKGRIVTEPTLRVPGVADAWAAGDCAAVPLAAGGTAPATAQFALRQGELIGANIRREFAGRASKPFTFAGLGELASIGHHNAVAKILGLKFSGFFAWWMWRSIYLFKLPGFDRKLRVMMDWTLDLVFPRDLSLLRTDTTPRLGTMHLEPGDNAFSTGDPAINFYIVKQGSIEIRDPQGPIKTLSAGQHFGESELLEPQPRRFDAVAAQPTELLVLPRSMFETLSLSSPEFANQLRSSALQYVSRQGMESLLSRLPEHIRSQPVRARMLRTVATIEAEATVRAVLHSLKRYAFSQFPVIDATGRFAGMLTRERFFDLIQATSATPESPLPPRAIEPAPTIAPDESIEQALRQMVRLGRRRLAVIDAGERLLGVMSLVDVVTD